MPAVLTGPIQLLLLWGLLAVVVPTRSKSQESPSVLFLVLCLDRDATALMSGELVPLKLLLGRKKSHLVLAVGMAAGQEPGRRVFLPSQCYCFLEGPWGSCWPGSEHGQQWQGAAEGQEHGRSLFLQPDVPLEQKPCLPPALACMVLVPQALQCT